MSEPDNAFEAFLFGLAIGAGVIGVTAWAGCTTKTKTTHLPAVDSPAPTGFALVLCQTYKSKRICVLRDTTATSEWSHTWRIDNGDPSGERLGSAQSALEAAMFFVDDLQLV